MDGKLPWDEGADDLHRVAVSASAATEGTQKPPFVAQVTIKEGIFMRKRKFTTKQLTLDAMLAAMCAVLGYLAIDTGTVKVTFESVPVLIAALMFGPQSVAVQPWRSPQDDRLSAFRFWLRHPS